MNLKSILAEQQAQKVQQEKSRIQSMVWLWTGIKNHQDKAHKHLEAEYYASVHNSEGGYAFPGAYQQYLSGKFSLNGLIENILNYWQQQLQIA